MNLKFLIKNIASLHTNAQKQAALAINQTLTIRNWLIGQYIVEYEQNGSDRQKYGSKLLQLIATDATKKNIKSLSVTNLKLCRQFYITYPQISKIAFGQYKNIEQHIISIGQTASDQFKKTTTKKAIGQTPSDQFSIQKNNLEVAPELILQHLSFSHFVALLKVNDPLQRVFYELQSIKENWSLMELNRAIQTQLYERTGLSKNKTAIIKKLKRDLPLTPEDIIKNPYVLEFAGLAEKARIYRTRFGKCHHQSFATIYFGAWQRILF